MVSAGRVTQGRCAMSRKRAFFRQKAIRAVMSHPEFVGCAIVAALIGHALLQTDWKPCTRQPHEILDRVSAARTALDQSDWPAEFARAGEKVRRFADDLQA